MGIISVNAKTPASSGIKQRAWRELMGHVDVITLSLRNNNRRRVNMSQRTIYVCDGCRHEQDTDFNLTVWDMHISFKNSQLVNNPFHGSFCNKKCLTKWLNEIVLKIKS